MHAGLSASDKHDLHPVAPAQANNQSAIDFAPNLLPRFIKAEANLLRLPLFALGTRGLRTLDAIECRGKSRRGGETYEFVFQAARNAKTQYPGPLSRAAHLAFLSIATDRGFPIENPIAWSWRDLCRRMEIQPSGRTVEHIKSAITATAGLLIRSTYALYSKANREPIRTSEDALHLYDRVTFVGSPLADGTIADANYLWLSDWYLQNLNAMFTAPLDYELWRFLDKRSSIASRQCSHHAPRDSPVSRSETPTLAAAQLLQRHAPSPNPLPRRGGEGRVRGGSTTKHSPNSCRFDLSGSCRLPASSLRRPSGCFRPWTPSKT